jgi:hypothetical protein
MDKNLLETMEKLKSMRIKYRNFFMKKGLGEIMPAGLFIKVKNNEEYKRLHKELINYFKEESFEFEHESAPSPRGFNKENFCIYLTSTVDNDDYKIKVGISVELHHEDEYKLNRDERLKFCY